MTELNVVKREAADSLDALRQEGKTPGVCYGPGFDNTLVAFDQNEFRKLYRDVGTSSVVNLTGDLEEQCFVQDMQVHVVSAEILHVDFKIVAKGQKTEVTVPVETTGESPAVHSKLGLLTLAAHELDVEAIPSKVPSEITVDISVLENVGDSIKVSDLKLPEGVEVLNDANTTIVAISAIKEEKEDEGGPSMEDVLADPNANTEEKEG